MKTRVIFVGLVGGLLLSACGGGLSHTIDDAEVKGLTGEAAAELVAARARVDEARAAYEASKKTEANSEAEAASAARRVDEAEVRVEAAEHTIEASQAAYQEAVDKAKARYDGTVGEAKAVYEAAVRDAKATYDVTVATAKGRRDSAVTAGKTELSAAEGAQALHEAAEEYKQALLAESAARREVKEADIWVARAEYELAKFEAVVKAKGRKGPDVTEERIAFSEQLAERQATLRAKQGEIARAERDTAHAKAAWDALKSKPKQPTPKSL